MSTKESGTRQTMSVRIPARRACPDSRGATCNASSNWSQSVAARCDPSHAYRLRCSPMSAQPGRTRTNSRASRGHRFRPGAPFFAKFCQRRYDSGMSTMNISLPDSLKDFVDEQVNERGYGTSSEYVRELIRKDKDRLRLRGLLLAGAESAPTKPVDEAYFDRLRRKIKSAKPGTRR
jgi:antitoxin ParD1/3/4